ncbi:disease resistance protein RGA5-like [Lolium perenne]|uniref:disease resistance protein RGA5-like n=1 Tax=Lolium perenne TaxID=4522 RepID=UPI0021F5A4EB|nr:disease resistance protein RGA5-like [Lolium perenne]XP_051195556.1 disease resistance protein RGA5-like [Lolium perenne]XP_051195557.1 disease resistance protein RGA5-like [Lolium perenne]
MATRIMVSASTGAMNALLGKLGTLMGEEFSKLKNLRKEVKFISDELGSMKGTLEMLGDVDNLDPQTERWRDTLREMSYDIEDIIDDFMHHIGEKSKNRWFARKIARLLKEFRARYRIASRIKEIKALVLETSARRQRYKFDIPSSSDVSIDPRLATLYENAANLVGVQAPMHEIISWVNDKEKQLKVASVVGFGGLGKTTLVNEVYRSLKGDFDCRAFVSVSQKPDITKLIHSLLSELRSETSSQICEFSVLLNTLREYLRHKRYLIIIDDIWNADVWRVIKCFFPENGLGSRVIATTRIQDVAKACSSHHRDYILNMKPLSNEDSRRLFFSRIFGLEEACPHHLRHISLEILKKCGGLPLAIISISSMLASEGTQQKERWEHVRDSLSSGTNLTLDGVRQILKLSYIDLPCHLKTCLLYLGMYPEDYTIERSNLERQWIAEGFITEENGQDGAEAAKKYFNEMVNRSLIQPVEFDSKGSVTRCRVHDMMLDLILHKSKKENFLTIIDDPQAITVMDYKPRRLSIRLDVGSNGRTILPRNISMSHVRTVMFFGRSQNTPPLSEFKFLRVLFFDLDHATVDLIGLCKLYQLRYLWISCFCSYQLPTQIRVLQQLQTLDLVSCSSVPSDIVYLAGLVHLNVDTWLPNGIGNMKSLQHLCRFDILVNSLYNIRSLRELTNLRYLIISCDYYAEDMDSRMDALRSSLESLCSLQCLFISLTGFIDGLVPLFPPLAPYRLERLIVSWKCRFSRVPRWMGELCNLRELQCTFCELLNDGVGILAELLFLTDLDLKVGRSIREPIIISGEGAFPALKRFKLRLSRASYLTFQAGAMPKLEMLKLMFNAHAPEQNRIAPTGIEHLLALEELHAEIDCDGIRESEKSSVESGLMSAINMHRNRPRVIIDLWDNN